MAMLWIDAWESPLDLTDFFEDDVPLFNAEAAVKARQAQWERERYRREVVMTYPPTTTGTTATGQWVAYFGDGTIGGITRTTHPWWQAAPMTARITITGPNPGTGAAAPGAFVEALQQEMNAGTREMRTQFERALFTDIHVRDGAGTAGAGDAPLTPWGDPAWDYWRMRWRDPPVEPDEGE